MTEQEVLHAFAGAGAGGGLIFTLGKIFIQKIVKNLEDSTQKVHDVLVRLSAISVRLEILDHHHTSINKLNEIAQTHGQLIAVLSSRLDSIKHVEK